MVNTLLTTWQLKADSDSTELVIPDGCRDLIFYIRPGRRPYWFLTSLDQGAYKVPVKNGDVYFGYRLTPGASILENKLLAAVQNEDFIHEDICSKLDSYTSLSVSVADALTCLASGVASVAKAAKQLGTNKRSLQRLILQHTSQTPVFWLQLARIRHAGRAVQEDMPLAEIALVLGFSDQSHMNREFQRWLGDSPLALRKGRVQNERLNEPGFA